VCTTWLLPPQGPAYKAWVACLQGLGGLPTRPGWPAYKAWVACLQGLGGLPTRPGWPAYKASAGGTCHVYSSRGYVAVSVVVVVYSMGSAATKRDHTPPSGAHLRASCRVVVERELSLGVVPPVLACAAAPAGCLFRTCTCWVLLARPPLCGDRGGAWRGGCVPFCCGLAPP
jgi:hypothetical protein